jgi:hypothetical protein
MRLARPNQTPQHTAMAHNWLRARRWNDPPPDGAVIDESGNIVEIEQDPGGSEDDFGTRFAEFERMSGVRPW